jgi:hypothetical protein
MSGGYLTSNFDWRIGGKPMSAAETTGTGKWAQRGVPHKGWGLT